MHRSHQRRRALVTSLVAVGLLAGTATVQADDSSSSPSAVETVGGFTRYGVPDGLDLSNLPSHASPDLEVTAVVQLDGASVLERNADATAAGARVDPAAAGQQVLAEQQAVGTRLQAAGARVDGHVTTVLNAVRVRVKVRDLAGLAGVAGVRTVHVSRTVTIDNGTSNAYTGVTQAWEDLGATGAGVSIAIIDDGIDYYHADFGGTGQAAYEADDGLQIEPGTFPTAKVVAGYDFAGDAYDADAEPGNPEGESPVPVPDSDPLPCGEHGTHVAGTAGGAGVLADGTTFAGPYDATTAGLDFLVAPGAAPEATLQAYKVFGCDGSSDDAVILAAIDAAVANGADVINMSLGSTFGSADEPIALAVDAASAAGVVVVMSAGNEGPGAYVLGGPSSANSGISVAAVDAVPLIPSATITGAATLVGQNSNAYDFVTPVTGALIDVGLGCTLEDFAPAVGKIAITTRGDCDRIARAILGTEAGALGVIFINNADGLPPVEGPIAGATIPFIGVTPADGATLQAAQGSSVTLNAGDPIANPGYQQFASFTSSGPRVGDSALKPDISAPGVNVLSAFVGTGTGSVLLSGTSMASPHAAGIAALVRQTHPGWDPKAIKGAMMSTAAPEGVADYSARRGGAGLVSARAAVDTVAYVSTTDGTNNLSFGFRELAGGLSITRTFKITNTSSRSITYDLASAIDDAGSGAKVKIEPSTITVPKHSTRTVAVRLRIPDPSVVPGAADSDGGALAAIDGFVVAQPRQNATGVHRLVVPLLMVPSPLANVTATAVRSAGKAKVPNAIKLSNKGLHTGDADFYQWAITDKGNDSPDARVPDIRDIGVQSFEFDETGPLVVFAISTSKPSSTQSTNEYDIFIDTTGDGIEDYILIGADYGLLTTGTPDGTMGSLLIAADGTPIDLFGAGAPANGTTVLLPMLAGDIGNPGMFSFQALSATVLADGVDVDVTDVGSFDPNSPAVSAVDPFDPSTAFPFVTLEPKQSVSIPVSVSPSGYAQDPLGWLIVTTDDGAGAKEADRVPLRP